jgi:hypothetical protein
VKAGNRIAFSFAVSNQGDVTVTYRYAVTESGPSGTVGVLDGDVRVASGRQSASLWSFGPHDPARS